MAGALVEVRDRLGQTVGIDPDLLGELAHRAAARKISRPHVGPGGYRERLGHAEGEVAQASLVGDEPRADFVTVGHLLDHRQRVIVIAERLVDEAAAIGENAYDAGLSAIEDVGKHASLPFRYRISETGQ